MDFLFFLKYCATGSEKITMCCIIKSCIF